MALPLHRLRLANTVLRQSALRTPSLRWTTCCRCTVPSNYHVAISRKSFSSQLHTSTRHFADSATSPSTSDVTIPTDAEVSERVLSVIKKADKVDANKVSIDSQYTGDLGLDSLDVVEVIMAVEDEFGIEIPDADADAMTTPKQTIEYVKNAVKKKA